jgi:predicted Fe-Mo cluster-binding NifX family protein
MKIAISVENNQGLESQSAHHFGRCPFFALVELNESGTDKLEIIQNPFFETHQPGQVPEFIHQQNAQVMISGGMGRRALEFFSQYGIEVKTGAAGSVKQVLEAYQGGELEEGSSCSQSEAHHRGHHHGGQHHE